MLASGQVVSTIAGRISGHTDAGARVASDRAWPWADSELPAWRVSAGSENVVDNYLDGLTVGVEVDINAEATVKATSGLEQSMNAIVAQAMPWIFAGPVPYSLEFLGIDREMEQTGESTLGQITVRLRAHIAYSVASPETLIST